MQARYAFDLPHDRSAGDTPAVVEMPAEISELAPHMRPQLIVGLSVVGILIGLLRAGGHPNPVQAA